jgi:hypothetical protein
VQLIDASGFWQKMRKSLGSKRKELNSGHIEEITKLFGAFQEAEQGGKPISKIFRNEDFGYHTITVDRPLRDKEGRVLTTQRGKGKGGSQADSDLRDTENVPLSEDIEQYFAREVLPYAPDAWIEHAKTKKGYEIPFNLLFYRFAQQKKLEDIDAELEEAAEQSLTMTKRVVGKAHKKHPNLKSSEIEWITSLPASWQIKPTKRIVRLLTNKTDSRECPVGLENIQSWTGSYVESDSEFQGDGIEFQPGDILFGKLRPYLAKAWLSDRKGEAVGDFHVLRPLAETSPRFMQYQLLCREVIDLADGSTYGAKMPRVGWRFLGTLKLPVPPLEEQSLIASFLDRETALIDSLIEKQEKLIDLLKERRKALVSAAVIGRLDTRGESTGE